MFTPERWRGARDDLLPRDGSLSDPFGASPPRCLMADDVKFRLIVGQTTQEQVVGLLGDEGEVRKGC
jgi:hypothetical protein